MTRNIYVAIYIVAMVSAIVSVDLLFFKGHLRERLLANVGIVLVFAAFYLRFMKSP
jgi:hypothetical protein